MTAAGWTTMIAICGFVWGGFLTVLVRAMRSEAAKTQGERA